MPAGADPLRGGDACIYQIKSNPVSLLPAPAGGRAPAALEFVLDGLLRGDTTARSAFYHTAILDGWMSRNEVRRLEGFHAEEGLDDFLYPTNEVKVGEETDNNTSQQ